jgi:hypothetical protein
VKISDTYVERQEVHVNDTVMQWVMAGVGGAAGLGAYFALSSGYRRSAVTTTPTSPATPSYAYQGDATIILPFVGAIAGFAAWNLLGRPNAPTETLAPREEVETRVEPRLEHTADVDGELTLRDGTPVGEVRGGHAAITLELAQRAWREGLLLRGRPLEWSLKADTWAPRLTAACQRTRDAAEAGSAFDAAPLGALARAARDAQACVGEGWWFAGEVARKLDRICRKRFDGPCATAAK